MGGVLLREFKSEILLVAFGNFTSWREISPSIQTLTKLLNFKVVLAHFALKVYREIPGTLLNRTGKFPVHFRIVPGISRHTPIIIVSRFSLFNRRVANQSKALGEEWNYWAFSLEFRQPDLGAKQ